MVMYEAILIITTYTVLTHPSALESTMFWLSLMLFYGTTYVDKLGAGYKRTALTLVLGVLAKYAGDTIKTATLRWSAGAISTITHQPAVRAWVLAYACVPMLVYLHLAFSQAREFFGEPET